MNCEFHESYQKRIIEVLTHNTRYKHTWTVCSPVVHISRTHDLFLIIIISKYVIKCNDEIEIEIGIEIESNPTQFKALRCYLFLFLISFITVLFWAHFYFFFPFGHQFGMVGLLVPLPKTKKKNNELPYMRRIRCQNWSFFWFFLLRHLEYSVPRFVICKWQNVPIKLLFIVSLWMEFGFTPFCLNMCNLAW